MRHVKPNILMVIPSLEMGGAQSNLLRLTTEFNRMGRKAIVLELKPQKRDQAYLNSLLNAGVEIFTPPFFLRNVRHKSPGFLESRNKLQRGFLKIKSESQWLHEFLLRHNIGAIHSHMYLADLYIQRHLPKHIKHISWLSKQCGCYNLIESALPDSRKVKFATNVKAIFGQLDGVVTMTQQHIDFLARHGIDLTTKNIYNGIRLPEPHDVLATPTLRCVMCARAEPTKGWEAAIRAFLITINHGHKITLDLIGSGPHLSQLETEYGHHPGLRFLGARSNPMSILSEYQVGLLPSTFKAESLPNTVIEYQASGLATVATAIGEIPQLIQQNDRQAGVLIGPNNQKQMAEEIASACMKYITCPELLADHRGHAIQLRHRFNVEWTAQAYLDFSDSLKPTICTQCPK